MKKLIIFMFILLIGFTTAADFTPQGNINMRGIYNMTGAPFVNATLFYGNGSQLIGISASGGGDGNASSICADGTFLNGDGTCDAGYLDADGVDDYEADTNTQLSGAQVIALVGNWTLDKASYYTSTIVDTLISSVGNWSADKAGYWDTANDLDTVISTDEITELKIDFNTACGAGSHLYVSGNNLACEADDDTTYSALSEFSDDIGVSADWDAIGDVPTATPSNGDTTHLSTADQIYDWVIGLGYATTSWVNTQLGNYYLKTAIDTQGEVETIWGTTLATDGELSSGLAGQDACSEISGCVVGAITSYSETDPLWTANFSLYNTSWSTDTDTNTQLSQENVQDYAGAMAGSYLVYTDGSNDLSVTDSWYNSLAELQTAVSSDFHNLGGSDANTQLSQENVEDYAGGMSSGTETRISFTYNDGTGNFDLVVDDMNDDNPEAGDVLWSDLTDQGTFTDTKYCTYASGTGYISCTSEGGVSTTYYAGTGLDLNGSDYFEIEEAFRMPQGCNNGEIAEYNTTSSGWDCAVDNSAASGMASWVLASSDTAGSESITDGETVTIDSGTGITATRSTNTVTITNTVTDTTCDDGSCNVTNTGTLDGYEAAALLDNTDTQLTEEEVEDFVGGMLGGTETHIAVTYEDGTNDIDFVVSDDWYNSIADIPTATPSNGDTTHVSTADQIFDYIASLAHLVAGDLANYWDATTDLDTVIATDEITELKIDFNTACAAGNHLYVSGNNLACEADDDSTYLGGNAITLSTSTFNFDGGASPGGELGGTWASPTLDNDALDDQYYDSEADLTTLLDNNYEPISAHFDASTTTNITCVNSACDWYTNATDSCMYWPSGGKDCGA